MGIVCMKSSPGVIVRSTRWDNPAQTPSGIPMSRLTSTAASVNASVSMASCHRPCSPMNSSPPTANSATLALPKAQETKPATATTPSQPSTGAGLPKAGWLIRPWITRTRVSITSRIGLKTYRKSGLVLRLALIASLRPLSQVCSGVRSDEASGSVLMPCSGNQSTIQAISTAATPRPVLMCNSRTRGCASVAIRRPRPR